MLIVGDTQGMLMENNILYQSLSRKLVAKKLKDERRLWIKQRFHQKIRIFKEFIAKFSISLGKFYLNQLIM